MGSTLAPKALRYGSWAAVVSAPAGSGTSADVVLQSSLAAQTELLQDCLARFESFLERAETALSRLSLLQDLMKTIPTSRPSTEVGVGSTKDLGTELYGCFSPRVGDSSSPLSSLPLVPSTAEGEAMAVAPVLQIMPDLQELCVSPSLPLSVEHLKVDLPVISCVQPDSDSPLSGEQLEVNSPEQSDVTFASTPPSPSHNSDVLFAKELCDLLSSVEVAIPGCGRAIACLLTGTKIKGKGKKVDDRSRSDIPKKKSLRCKDKKSGSIGKAPAAA